jgi:uncharacterized protein (TIGR00369 family)
MTGSRASITIDEAHAILEANFADWVRDLDLTVVEALPDHVVMRIGFSPKLCRIGGIVCGQALIAAADTAMVIALASAQGGMRPMTTVDLTINFMRPIRDQDVRLSAAVKRFGKTLAFCTTEIEGTAAGKLSAFATGTYAILD